MYNITNNTELSAIVVNTSQNIPILFPLILFFEFMVIAIGGSFANARRVGFTNLSMWFAIAGLITTTSAFILFLVDGIINLVTLGVCVAVTLGCVAWFMFTGDET